MSALGRCGVHRAEATARMQRLAAELPCAYNHISPSGAPVRRDGGEWHGQTAAQPRASDTIRIRGIGCAAERRRAAATTSGIGGIARPCLFAARRHRQRNERKPLPTLRPSFSPRPMGIDRTSWALSTGRNRGSLRWHAIPIGRMKASYSRDSTTCGLTRKQNRGSLENKNRTLLLKVLFKLSNNGTMVKLRKAAPATKKRSKKLQPSPAL